jgi:predicted secreted hydrolase
VRLALQACVAALGTAGVVLASLAATPPSVAPEPSPPAAATSFPIASPDVRLSFPRDHGSHPEYRIEWWYVTGWLQDAAGKPLGFQVTFFRSRTTAGDGNPSAFAPRQILFAHAAVSDPARGRLLHDSRAAREGFGIARASAEDADVRIGNWRFKRRADGVFTTSAQGDELRLTLAFRPTQPVLPQGINGYSRKGALPSSASIYYSVPHLEVTGEVRRGSAVTKVTGRAWLDREWSSSYLESGAAGWDWTGLNFDDGGALMAFRIRDGHGRSLWAGGSYRSPQGAVTLLGPADISFVPRRIWRSPRTGGAYPIDPVLQVRINGERRLLPLDPMFPDQELDSRSTGGPVYWEGAVRTTGGRGYLELTGYAGGLAL